MTDARYSPPTARVADPTAFADGKRPWIIPVTRFGACVLVAFMLWSGYGTITSAAAWVEIGAIPHKTFWALGWRVVTIAAFVVMLFQLPSRSQLARWSGVCALMSCAVFPVLWAWLNKPPPGSGAEYFGYILGLMLVLSPFALWAYGFGFARRAKAYFVATPATEGIAARP